jgi:hypothetical protein
MEDQRYKIIFDKMEDEKRKTAEVMGAEEFVVGDDAENDEIAELRRIVLETTDTEPCFFTST